MKKPQPLLAEGERKVTIAWNPLDADHGRRRLARHIDARRHCGQLRRVKNLTQGELDLKLVPNPRQQLNRREGMAAKLEEDVH